MSLVDILSLEGLLLTLIHDRILTLRLVSRKIMMALESNICIKLNLCISDSGVEGLTAAFLTRWQGRVCLSCNCQWMCNSRWFKEVRMALLLGQLRPLGRLSLSVEGPDLLPLVETLVGIGTAIRKLDICYCGYSEELIAAAASLASLGDALTMGINVYGIDCGGRQMSLWLRLLAPSIRISSVAFRSCEQPLP